MIKKQLPILIITAIIILLPIVAGAIIWEQLPDKIPTHWNAAGEVDGYSGKGFAVFGIPLMMLGFQLIAFFATLADPKRKNNPPIVLSLVLWIIPIITVILTALTYVTAIGAQIKVGVVLPMVLGLIFVVLGSILPKCKQNYTIGIKLPWTLHSEENWNKTHRLAGWVWMLGGIGTIISGAFDLFLLSIPFIAAMVVIPTIYSFVLYKKGI